MNTKTITIDGEQITVTQYGENDFDIHFRDDDWSERGTMLDVVKAFADWQQSVGLGDPVVWFDYNDMAITNPWIDDTGRFPLDSKESADKYGLENVLQFIIDACMLLRPTDDRGEA